MCYLWSCPNYQNTVLIQLIEWHFLNFTYFKNIFDPFSLVNWLYSYGRWWLCNSDQRWWLFSGGLQQWLMVEVIVGGCGAEISGECGCWWWWLNKMNNKRTHAESKQNANGNRKNIILSLFFDTSLIPTFHIRCLKPQELMTIWYILHIISSQQEDSKVLLLS